MLNKLNKKLYLKDLRNIFAQELSNSIPPTNREEASNIINNINMPKLCNNKFALSDDSLITLLNHTKQAKQNNSPNIFIFFGEPPHKIVCSGANLLQISSHLQNNSFFSYNNLAYFLFDYFHLPEHRTNSISIWNGVIIGGGVGLTINSKFRISTETTLFMMPEILFGFFPNSLFCDFISKFLSKEETFCFSFLAKGLNGGECLKKGISTHFVLNKYIDELIEKINKNVERSEEIIEEFNLISLKEFNIEKDLEKNNLKESEIFKESPEKFLDFYLKYKNLFTKYEKNSLFLTFVNNKEAFNENLSYEDKFNLEIDITEAVIKYCQVSEGIRANFIDKDKNPQWKENIEGFNELSLKFKYF